MDIFRVGAIPQNDILQAFHASNHPEVVSGRRLEGDIFQEFMQTLDSGREVHGKVTRNEFVNYYANIGACIDNDEYFEQIVRGVWKVRGSENCFPMHRNPVSNIKKLDRPYFVYDD